MSTATVTLTLQEAENMLSAFSFCLDESRKTVNDQTTICKLLEAFPELKEKYGFLVD